ncbi:MAG: aminotransferase class V-fold PLP-dependent enzyme [Actinobacteria bacterium]|nr:aminotransferase class V-fold PLP-dependent enzyme [Actinomycetota bacterium]
MVRVTGNFTSQSPLHPAAKALLIEAFGQGWADPAKIGDDSARTAILRNEAIESIAQNLALQPSEIEVIGEPRLGQHLAISGLLKNEQTLLHSSVDRRSVFAVGVAHESSGGKTRILNIGSDGRICELDPVGEQSVLALQGANIETGITQNVDHVIEKINPTYVALDYSAAPNLPLPIRWDSAIFDATSWQGPAGIGILAIRNSTAWKNPLPNLGIRRTPESSSLPLLLASAVALDEWLKIEKTESARINELNKLIRKSLSEADLRISFAGSPSDSVGQTIALVAEGCVGEDLVRQLNEINFVLDSGSACTAAQMQPSHVLAALGMKSEGNLRITLHHGVTEAEVRTLIGALTSVVQKSR